MTADLRNRVDLDAQIIGIETKKLQLRRPLEGYFGWRPE
jgi:hypothetical protein